MKILETIESKRGGKLTEQHGNTIDPGYRQPTQAGDAGLKMYGTHADASMSSDLSPVASPAAGYVYTVPSGAEIVLPRELDAGETIKDPQTGDEVVPTFSRMVGDDERDYSARTISTAVSDKEEVDDVSGKVGEITREFIEKSTGIFQEYLQNAGADLKEFDYEVGDRILNMEACIGTDTASEINATELGNALHENLGARVIIPEVKQLEKEGSVVMNVVVGDNRKINETFGGGSRRGSGRRSRKLSERREPRRMEERSLRRSRRSRRGERSLSEERERGGIRGYRRPERGIERRGRSLGERSSRRYSERRERRSLREEPARRTSDRTRRVRFSEGRKPMRERRYDRKAKRPARRRTESTDYRRSVSSRSRRLG